MVKFLSRVFKDRNQTQWEKEINQVKRDTWKERNETLAPRFAPQNGIYEYSRRFDYRGKNRKGSCYQATLRLSFSPATDYGWLITGIGTEYLSVRGIKGGDPRKIIIDDGRVTSNGKFYWKEIREKGVEIIVAGTIILVPACGRVLLRSRNRSVEN